MKINYVKPVKKSTARPVERVQNVGVLPVTIVLYTSFPSANGLGVGPMSSIYLCHVSSAMIVVKAV